MANDLTTTTATLYVSKWYNEATADQTTTYTAAQDFWYTTDGTIWVKAVAAKDAIPESSEGAGDGVAAEAATDLTTVFAGIQYVSFGATSPTATTEAGVYDAKANLFNSLDDAMAQVYDVNDNTKITENVAFTVNILDETATLTPTSGKDNVLRKGITLEVKSDAVGGTIVSFGSISSDENKYWMSGNINFDAGITLSNEVTGSTVLLQNSANDQDSAVTTGANAEFGVTNISGKLEGHVSIKPRANYYFDSATGTLQITRDITNLTGNAVLGYGCQDTVQACGGIINVIGSDDFVTEGDVSEKTAQLHANGTNILLRGGGKLNLTDTYVKVNNENRVNFFDNSDADFSGIDIKAITENGVAVADDKKNTILKNELTMTNSILDAKVFASANVAGVINAKDNSRLITEWLNAGANGEITLNASGSSVEAGSISSFQNNAATFANGTVTVNASDSTIDAENITLYTWLGNSINLDADSTLTFDDLKIVTGYSNVAYDASATNNRGTETAADVTATGNKLITITADMSTVTGNAIVWINGSSVSTGEYEIVEGLDDNQKTIYNTLYDKAETVVDLSDYVDTDGITNLEGSGYALVQTANSIYAINTANVSMDVLTVNAAWAEGYQFGADVLDEEGNATGKVLGINAFADIQTAIDAAQDGAKIDIVDASFAKSLTIDKNVTLSGTLDISSASIIPVSNATITIAKDTNFTVTGTSNAFIVGIGYSKADQTPGNIQVDGTLKVIGGDFNIQSVGTVTVSATGQLDLSEASQNSESNYSPVCGNLLVTGDGTFEEASLLAHNLYFFKDHTYTADETAFDYGNLIVKDALIKTTGATVLDYTDGVNAYNESQINSMEIKLDNSKWIAEDSLINLGSKNGVTKDVSGNGASNAYLELKNGSLLDTAGEIIVGTDETFTFKDSEKTFETESVITIDATSTLIYGKGLYIYANNAAGESVDYKGGSIVIDATYTGKDNVLVWIDGAASSEGIRVLTTEEEGTDITATDVNNAITFTEGSKEALTEAGYTVVENFMGSYYAYKTDAIDTTTITVSSEWAGSNIGDKVGKGLTYGVNAFSSMDTVLSELVTGDKLANISKIVLADAAVSTKSFTPKNPLNVTISSSVQGGTTWNIAAATYDGSADDDINLLSGSKVTIAENITMVFDGGVALYPYSNSHITIHGDLKNLAALHVNAEGSATITKTASVEISGGDGLLNVNEGTISVTGTGDFTTVQVDAGYTYVRDGGTLTLKDTYVDGGKEIIFYRTGEDYKGKTNTVILDNSKFTVGNNLQTVPPVAGDDVIALANGSVFEITGRANMSNITGISIDTNSTFVYNNDALTLAEGEVISITADYEKAESGLLVWVDGTGVAADAAEITEASYSVNETNDKGWSDVQAQVSSIYAYNAATIKKTATTLLVNADDLTVDEDGKTVEGTLITDADGNKYISGVNAFATFKEAADYAATTKVKEEYVVTGDGAKVITLTNNDAFLKYNTYRGGNAFSASNAAVWAYTSEGTNTNADNSITVYQEKVAYDSKISFLVQDAEYDVAPEKTGQSATYSDGTYWLASIMENDKWSVDQFTLSDTLKDRGYSVVQIGNEIYMTTIKEGTTELIFAVDTALAGVADGKTVKMADGKTYTVGKDIFASYDDAMVRATNMYLPGVKTTIKMFSDDKSAFNSAKLPFWASAISVVSGDGKEYTLSGSAIHTEPSGSGAITPMHIGENIILTQTGASASKTGYKLTVDGSLILPNSSGKWLPLAKSLAELNISATGRFAAVLSDDSGSSGIKATVNVTGNGKDLAKDAQFEVLCGRGDSNGADFTKNGFYLNGSTMTVKDFGYVRAADAIALDNAAQLILTNGSFAEAGTNLVVTGKKTVTDNKGTEDTTDDVTTDVTTDVNSAIKMDYTSKVAYTNKLDVQVAGGIVIDMTGATGDVYQVIDNTGATNATVNVAEGGIVLKGEGFTQTEYRGDVLVYNTTNVKPDSVIVSGNYSELDGGDKVVIGEGENAKTYYIGLNAFDNLADAANAATITLTSDYALSSEYTVGEDKTLVMGAYDLTGANVTVAGNGTITLSTGAAFGGSLTNNGIITVDATGYTTGTIQEVLNVAGGYSGEGTVNVTGAGDTAKNFWSNDKTVLFVTDKEVTTGNVTGISTAAGTVVNKVYTGLIANDTEGSVTKVELKNADTVDAEGNKIAGDNIVITGVISGANGVEINNAGTLTGGTTAEGELAVKIGGENYDKNVTIANKGHLNADVKTTGTISITENTASETLTGSYSGGTIDLANGENGKVSNAIFDSTGAMVLDNDGIVENSKFTANVQNIALNGAGSYESTEFTAGTISVNESLAIDSFTTLNFGTLTIAGGATITVNAGASNDVGSYRIANGTSDISAETLGKFVLSAEAAAAGLKLALVNGDIYVSGNKVLLTDNLDASGLTKLDSETFINGGSAFDEVKDALSTGTASSYVADNFVMAESELNALREIAAVTAGSNVDVTGYTKISERTDLLNGAKAYGTAGNDSLVIAGKGAYYKDAKEYFGGDPKDAATWNVSAEWDESTVDLDLRGGKNTVTVNGGSVAKLASLSNVSGLEVKDGVKKSFVNADKVKLTETVRSGMELTGNLMTGEGTTSVKIGNFADFSAAGITKSDLLGMNKVSVGSSSKLVLSSAIVKGNFESMGELKVGSNSTVTAGALNGVDNASTNVILGNNTDATFTTLNLGAGKNNVTVGNGNGQNVNLEADALTGFAGLTAGKDAVLNIKAVSGSDDYASSIKLGDRTSMTAESIVLGAGKNSITLGKDADLTVKGDVTDAASLTIGNGILDKSNVTKAVQSYAEANIGGDLVMDKAAGTIKLGSFAKLNAAKITNESATGSVGITLTIGANSEVTVGVNVANVDDKGTTFTPGAIENISGITLTAGKAVTYTHKDKYGVVDANQSFGGETSLVAGDITGTVAANTIKAGNNTLVNVGAIDLKGGKNKIDLGGQNVQFDSKSISNVQTFKVGAGKYDKKLGAYAANATIDIDGDFTGVNGANTIDLGAGSDTDITGSILESNLGGTNTIKLGTGATLKVGTYNKNGALTGNGDIDALAKLTLGADADLFAGDITGANDGKDTTVELGKGADLTAGTIDGVRTMTLKDNATATIGDLEFGIYKSNTLDVQTGANFTGANVIGNDGADAVKLGKNATLDAGVIDLGAGKNSVSLNAAGAVLEADEISGLNSLTVKSGALLKTESLKGTSLNGVTDKATIDGDLYLTGTGLDITDIENFTLGKGGKIFVESAEVKDALENLFADTANKAFTNKGADNLFVFDSTSNDNDGWLRGGLDESDTIANNTGTSLSVKGNFKNALKVTGGTDVIEGVYKNGVTTWDISGASSVTVEFADDLTQDKKGFVMYTIA